MADTITVENLTDIDPSLQPLADAVTSILNIPDEGLNTTTLESIQGMIAGSFTASQREESVRSLKETFKEMRYSRPKAMEVANEAKNQLAALIENLDTTPEKKLILRGMFANIYEVFDAAVANYFGETIDLPVKISEDGHIPEYAHETDAAADLYASENMIISANTMGNMVHTGVHIALPEGWTAFILPRSSMGLKTPLRLSNSVGVIDSDYRGEICALYDNISDSDYEIHKGDRIAQMIIMPAYRFRAVEVDELPKTERNEGGFGSTGK